MGTLKGYRKLVEIHHTKYRRLEVLGKFRDAHSIPYRITRVWKSDRWEGDRQNERYFTRFFVRAQDLCCARAVLLALGDVVEVSSISREASPTDTPTSGLSNTKAAKKQKRGKTVMKHERTQQETEEMETGRDLEADEEGDVCAYMDLDEGDEDRDLGKRGNANGAHHR